MSNRHYRDSIQEVWDSYEHLFRDDLERMDYRARQMFKEMQFTRTKEEVIREFLIKRFAELWESVASDQEENAKYKRSRK